MATEAELLRAIRIAVDEGDFETANELAALVEGDASGNVPRETSTSGPLSRFSQGAIGAGAQLLDVGQFLAGVPGSGQRAMNTAQDLGITDPSALQATDLATTLGRQVPGLALGALRPGAMGAELASAAGGGLGEFLGQQVGGNVGGFVGGLTGSLAGAGAAAGTRAALGGQAGAAANLEASRALGTQVGLGEVGGSPLARFIDRTSQALPGGNLVARARATRIGLQARARVEQVANSLPGPQVVSPEEAGRLIREGFVGFVERRKAVANGLFDRFRETVGNGQTFPAQYRNALRQLNVTAEAQTESSRVFGRSSADLINSASQALQSDLQRHGGSLSGAQLDAIRRRIGEDLTDVSLIGTPVDGVNKKLYGAITADMERLARAQGPQAEKAFNRARAFWDRLRKDAEQIQRNVVRDGTDTQLLEALERSARGGPEVIRTLKRTVPEKNLNGAIRVVLRRMGQETPGQRDVTDVAESWDLGRFLTNWNRLDTNGGLRALFAGRTQVARDFARDMTRIAKVAAGARETIRIQPNPSGTAARAVQVGVPALAAGGAALGYVPEALQAMAAVGGGSIALQQWLSSPRFIGWMAESTRIPVGQLPQHVERLRRVVEEEPGSRELVETFLGSFQ